MDALDARVSDKQEIRLAELLGALSRALDMVEGQLSGHCVRCCWIGIHIGREAGLNETEIWELYYTLLLKDLGCTSTSARIHELYLTDDISFKRDVAMLDGSMPRALRFILMHTGSKAGLAKRLRTLAHVIHNRREITTELLETRCYRGAEIARKIRFSDSVAQGVQNLEEHWDGSGHPDGVRGDDISIYARIALLARTIDVFQTADGVDAAKREVENRAATWFDPKLVMAFTRVAADSKFWDTLGSETLQKQIFALEPAQHTTVVDDDYLDDIAAAFAQVVDSKSPYTSGHSERVTLYSDMIAAEMGLSDTQRRWLRRAALLHDIGKLGVSNAILDKPGKLDAAEWEAMKMHAAHTETILSQIGAFEDLAKVAGAHHERLDGTGYPHGLKGDEITLETRIITVADIFDALTDERPYRAAMPEAKALEIMTDMVGPAIDADCFAALRTGLKRIDRTAAA